MLKNPFRFLAGIIVRGWFAGIYDYIGWTGYLEREKQATGLIFENGILSFMAMTPEKRKTRNFNPISPRSLRKHWVSILHHEIPRRLLVLARHPMISALQL